MALICILFYLFSFSLRSCSAVKEIIQEDVLPIVGSRVEAFSLITVSGRGEAWSSRTEEPRNVQTCGTGQDADFWFITRHVDLTSVFADVIYVDVEAELTWCDDPGDDKLAKCYSNYFEVYIHRGADKPKFNLGTVTPRDVLGKFSPLYNITNNTSPHATLSRQTLTFSFYPNGSNVTFAVRSRGACGKIFNMNMYYYFCEEKFVNSVRLKRTSSPVSGSKVVTAVCSNYSQPLNNATSLMGHCHSNGSWSMNKDFKCLCIQGHEPNERRGCSPCSSDSFKQNISNSMCTKCLARSESIKNKTSCGCKKGFYRNPSDDSELAPCYELLKLDKMPKISMGKSGVILKWNKPETANSLDKAIFYDVECFVCKEGACNAMCVNVEFMPAGGKDLKNTSVSIHDLQPGKSYVFRVYPKNKLNERLSKEKWNFNFTERFIFQPKSTEPPTESSGGSDSTGNIIIAVIAVSVFVLFVLLVIFAWRRRGNVKNKHMQTFLNSGVDIPNVGLKTYVDPTIYSNAEEAVEEFANELDPRLILLERLIGGGEFGDVYKGEMTTNGRKKIAIAVKTLKHDASPKNSRDFLIEASVMAQFDNPNVVRMEGVVTKTKPRMIVIEYMCNGSLQNYLKSNDGMLTRLQLLGMTRGIAAGMNYLAEVNFVHRDLAARNVLVNDALLCKISDFGLSRELEATTENSLGEYATSGGKIPIRWTAPEAIKYRKFSTASDVWSFGILLWEIMSFAQRPYWEWDNFKVLEEVDNGFRLPPPQKCPLGVHGLMLHCWKTERSERPSFAQITIVIDRWIKSPETLDDELNFFITIGEWLTSIKMASYKTMFIEAGYRKQSEIVDLSDEDLKTIGVTLIGHRNKIMKGIETLKARKTRQSTPL